MSLINTIACGDCREILPTLPAKSFQLAFADPPYWVGFDYGDKTDKQMDYIEPHWLVNELRRVAEYVLVTPGIANQFEYPKPDWTIGWFKPASNGRNKFGGFNVWEPIFFYGDLQGRLWQDAISLHAIANRAADGEFFHKCPKPEKLMRWLVENFTSPGDKVLDPCSGSGTTCKAAFQLGREYLGIEIDPEIAKLSLARVRNSQPPLLAVGGLTKRAADGGNAAPEFSNFE